MAAEYDDGNGMTIAQLDPPTTTERTPRFRVERSLDADDRQHPWLVMDDDGDVVSRWTWWAMAYGVARYLAGDRAVWG
jgi:hypothetical protein